MLRADRHTVNEAAPAFLNLTEAAAVLGVHRNTLAAAIRAGALPCLRIGRQILIPKAALDLAPGVQPSEPVEAGE